MRFSTRSVGIGFRLALLTPIFLAFQNCNQKLGTNTDVSGEMTTRIAIDTPQLKLEDMVRSYYVNILGREPNAQEMASAVAQIRGGLTGQSLLQNLATSGEALAKLASLLTQAFGSSNNASLESLVNLLLNGSSLSQIKTLLGLPATA